MRHQTASLAVFTLCLSIGLCSSASGQKEFGFSMPSGMKKVEIAFEEYSNLIVIPVTLNKSLTLKFILDTGVETAILTKKIFADIMNAHYIQEFAIAGPGVIDSVEVLVANRMTFYLPGGLIGQNMNLMVLKEDYLKLSENMGEEIYGIIGYDIFSRFVVEINYDTKRIVLHDPKVFKPKKRATVVPIEIRNTKPFLKTSISQEGKTNLLDIMIDTGSSHVALIDFGKIPSSHLPKDRIVTKLGRGIAGEIPGYLSRLDHLSIAEFIFDEVLFATPFDGVYNKAIKRGSKYGTIGGELLKRFNLIFDYHNGKIYMKKSKRYHDSFEYDMSGLTINVKGEKLDSLEIVDIKKDSPAYRADMRKGDILLGINHRSSKNYKLSEVYGILRKRPGMKVKCEILRDGEKLKKTFYLKRMI